MPVSEVLRRRLVSQVMPHCRGPFRSVSLLPFSSQSLSQSTPSTAGPIPSVTPSRLAEGLEIQNERARLHPSIAGRLFVLNSNHPTSGVPDFVSPFTTAFIYTNSPIHLFSFHPFLSLVRHLPVLPGCQSTKCKVVCLYPATPGSNARQQPLHPPWSIIGRYASAEHLKVGL